MTKEEIRGITAIIAGLAGLATAVGSCNSAAQDRLKADNKIYTTLAEGQKQQAADISELHKQIDELRGYLQAVRSQTPPQPESPVLTPLSRPLIPPNQLFRTLQGLSPSPSPTEPLPEVPSPAPAPVLRPLPRFEDLAEK